MRLSDPRTRAAILAPSPYFNWSQSLSMLASSGATDLLDQIDLETNRLRRPLILSDGIYMLEVQAQEMPGDENQLLQLSLQANDTHEELPSEQAMQEAEAWLNRRFQLDLDMDEVRAVLNATKPGRMLVERFWPDRPAHLAGPWEGLLKTIIGNQIYPGLSRRLQTGLIQAYGEPVSFSGEPIYLYPEPERLAFADPELLLSLRFSRQKAHALPNLARMIIEDPDTYDWQHLRNIKPENAVEILDRLPGVGPFTAQYIVLRGLPHTDYFLTYGDEIKKTLARLWGARDTPSDADAQRLVSAWSPYRRVACYYTYEFMYEMRDLPVEIF